MDAVLAHPNGKKLYFFRGPRYVRFDLATDKADRGYPKAIADHWRGLPADGVDAAVAHPNGKKLYFFRGPEYVRFDVASDKVDAGYPEPIRDHWRGLNGFSSRVDAVVAHPNGRKLYFFRNAEYARFDLAADRTDPGYPKLIRGNWKGLGSFERGVDAAVAHPNGNKLYFFRGAEYVRFDLPADKVDAGYPKPVQDHWEGVESLFNEPPRPQAEPVDVAFVAVLPDRASDNHRAIHDEPFGYERLDAVPHGLRGVSFRTDLPPSVLALTVDERGRIVGLAGTGRRMVSDRWRRLHLFRLAEDGSTDPTFGGGRPVEVPLPGTVSQAWPAGLVADDDGVWVGLNVAELGPDGLATYLVGHVAPRVLNPPSDGGPGFQAGDWERPPTDPGFETLTGMVRTGRGRIVLCGTDGDRAFGDLNRFVHLQSPSGVRLASVTAWPVPLGAPTAPAPGDDYGGRVPVTVGADVNRRAYVAVDGADGAVHLWRLDDDGGPDASFPPVRVAAPSGARLLRPVSVRFGRSSGALLTSSFHGDHEVRTLTLFTYDGAVTWTGRVSGASTAVPTSDRVVLVPPGDDRGQVHVGLRTLGPASASARSYVVGGPLAALTPLAVGHPPPGRAGRTVLGGTARVSSPRPTAAVTVAPAFRPSLHGFRFSNRAFEGVFMEALSQTRDGQTARLGAAGRWSLCGGMVQAAVDHFVAGRPIPDHVGPPPVTSPLMRYVTRRQKDSFEAGAGSTSALGRVFHLVDTLSATVGAWVSGGDAESVALYKALSRDFPVGATFVAFWALKQEAYADQADYRAQFNAAAWPEIKRAVDARGWVQVGLVYALKDEGGALWDNHQVLVTGYSMRGHRTADLVDLTVYDPNDPGGEDERIVATATPTWTGGPSIPGAPTRTVRGLTLDRVFGDGKRRPVHAMFPISVPVATPP